MKESVAKRSVRRMFYKNCVGAWLTSEEIKKGNILTLLGDEPREIPFIDELGFARQNVYSVERDYDIYKLQERMAIEENLGITTYFGTLIQYLEIMLHQFGNFVALNLDVEGSYKTQIDQAMTSVIMFCRFNPRTVVASYSSIGRDTISVWQGIHSLALLYWLAPEITDKLIASLLDGYSKSGSTQPIRFVLRDLFWITSQLEHSLRVSFMTESREIKKLDRFNTSWQLIWNAIGILRKRVLKIKHVCEIIKRLTDSKVIKIERVSNIKLSTHIGRFMQVYYNARRPWSERCYFTRYDYVPKNKVAIRDWINKLCEMFISEPFVYCDREGETYVFDISQSETKDVREIELWKGMDLYDDFLPRKLRKASFPRQNIDRLKKTQQKTEGEAE